MSDTDELVFVPLGGLGEIGMNAALYGFGPERRRKWILIDCGMGFAGEEGLPGIDVARYVLEATLARAVREARVSSGFARDALGHGFHEGQDWLLLHRAHPDWTEEDLRAELDAVSGLVHRTPERAV